MKAQDKSGMKRTTEKGKRDTRSKRMTRGQEKYTTLQHAVIVGVSDDSRVTKQDVHIFRLNLSL